MMRRSATLFAALGDETRIQLLVMLGTGVPQSIKQLAMDLPVTRQAVTKHLRVLEKANFVTQETHGRERRFCARVAAIEEAKSSLSLIAQQWDDALLRLKNFAENS
jgi:DNA-binding transcriptional ArsR family regulator